MVEDGSDFADQSPTLAIIEDDEVYMDPMGYFPYQTHGESLVAVVKKIANFFQYGKLFPPPPPSLLLPQIS